MKSSFHYYQHVTCTTRGHATFDLLYINVKDAHISLPLPQLGDSDHNLVLLQPKYRPLVQRREPRIISVQQWNPDAVKQLQSAFDDTD